MAYMKIIEQAIVFFPVLAILITIPFVLIQYHKYGSISKLKSLLIYSFVLYLLCAYFLVIMPLPSREFVDSLTTDRVQLIPFRFIFEFFNSIDYQKNILKQSYFYMPFFNILLVIPFGIYIKYFFKVNVKKCIKYSFLLSLFFELTQLSGLYFIYSRGYRLFDVDDLLLNTLGGVIGYYIGSVLTKPLPGIDEVNNMALEKGQKISGLKRSVSFLLDIFLCFFLTILVSIFVKDKYALYVSACIYYVVIPLIRNGSTLGQKFLNLKIEYSSFLNVISRFLVFCLIYFIIPYLLLSLILVISISSMTVVMKEIIIIVLAIIIFLIYFITFIKFLFTNHIMLYERFSKTKLVSTVGKKLN